MNDYDIVIVGAGITGATMTLALADSGLRIALVDSRPLQDRVETPADSMNAYDARVSAMTAASQRLLANLGVWQTLPAGRLCAYTRMHVHEQDGTGSIDFAARDIHAPELGHIVENSVLTGALHDRLRQLANAPEGGTTLTILAPETLDTCQPAPESGVQLTLNGGQHLGAGLLIAADGANSPLRKLAGFDTREWDYEHHAIVTTIKTRDPHQFTARQCFMDDGVLAFLPLASAAEAADADHYSSIVWSLVPERAAELMAMDEAAFCQALSQVSEHWLGPVAACAQRFSFPLRQRHARDYSRDSVVLIGDAAHSIHPLAGQGANLGLLDVQVLAEELLHAGRTGRALTDPMVLRRYQRRRKPHNLAMMAMMEGFRHLYAEQPLAVRWLRNTGMRAVDRWPLLKNRLMREALG